MFLVYLFLFNKCCMWSLLPFIFSKWAQHCTFAGLRGFVQDGCSQPLCPLSYPPPGLSMLAASWKGGGAQVRSATGVSHDDPGGLAAGELQSSLVVQLIRAAAALPLSYVVGAGHRSSALAGPSCCDGWLSQAVEVRRRAEHCVCVQTAQQKWPRKGAHALARLTASTRYVCAFRFKSN